MRWWGGERWSDHFLKTRSASGGSGTPGSPKRGRRLGGAPWWAWVVAVIVGIVIIAAIVGRDESSHDNDGTTQSEAPAPPPAASSRATKKSLTSCLTSAGVPVDTSGPSAQQTTIDGEYVGTVTFGRGGSAGVWVMSPVSQLHPIRRAREIVETSGGGYYWDANRNIVLAIPADANLSLGDPVGKEFDACLNG
jgi:hypothetical protein